MGNGLDGFRCTPAQGIDVDHIAPAHMAEQAADGGLLGRNGDIDVVPLHQVHVGRVGNQRHHLAGAKPFGQQGGHDVGFVIVGERAEHIGVFDVGLEQFVPVGGQPLQYYGLVQFLAQPFRPFGHAFQNFDVVAMLNGFRQAVTDVAAAGDNDALVVMLQAAQLTHDRTDIVFGGDEEHLIVGFDHGVAFRDDWPAAAENSCDAGIHVGHVLAQFAQFVAHQRSTVIGAHRHQLYPATGEVHHLQGARVFDQALDVVGHHLFRADDHINGQGVLVEQFFRAAGVVGGANAGDLGGGAEQGVGHLTGDHVDLVRVGHRDQHVRIFGAGFLEYCRVAAHAAHGADIQAVTQLAQALIIGVDDRDVVAFIGQVFGQSATHLAGTENNDFHELSRAPDSLRRQAR